MRRDGFGIIGLILSLAILCTLYFIIARTYLRSHRTLQNLPAGVNAELAATPLPELPARVKEKVKEFNASVAEREKAGEKIIDGETK